MVKGLVEKYEEDIGMKALLWLRTAHRIMQVISTSTQLDSASGAGDEWNIVDRHSLYEFIQSTTPVQSILGDGKGGLLTLSVTTVLNGQVPKDLCHSHYTSLTVKNALVDLIRDIREDGMRPNVDVDDADVPLVLVLRGVRVGDKRQRGGDEDGLSCEATLFRALHSGGSLHKRGYRSSAVHKAAMKESLAAGLLLEAGYDKLIAAAKEDGMPAVLVDPMAGSGTFCIEAAMIASDFAPGLMRMKCHDGTRNGDRNPHQLPPVVRWKGSDRAQWKELVLEARDRAEVGLSWLKGKKSTDPMTRNCIIMGNEINPNAASLARDNIAKAGFSAFISIDGFDCVDWDLGGEVTDDSPKIRIVIPGRTIVVSNPPWGLRLTEDIERSWLSLKSFLRNQCNGAEAWILSGNKDTTRVLRMKKSRSVVIQTADEDLRWIQYHVFQKKITDLNVYDARQSSSQVHDGLY
jgi:putative N6-adenine-specific DNA methylase